MAVSEIDVHPNYQPADMVIKAFELALAASQDFKSSSTEQPDFADICRKVAFSSLAMEWIRIGQVVPVLNKETGVVEFRATEDVLGEQEAAAHCKALEKITGGKDSEERRRNRVDRRVRKGLSAEDRQCIELAAKQGVGMSKEDVDDLIFLLDRNHREGRVVFDVVRGESYLRLGLHGQLLFRPVSELSQECRELLFQKRAFAGLSPLSTIEMESRRQSS